MKKRIKNWVSVFALLLLVNEIPAQQKIKQAPWVSEKGYWVLQTNVNTPLYCTVSFYNNANLLMYSERLVGIRLDTNKRKVKMKLKKALETIDLVWQETGVPTGNKQYVMAMLR
ncbi:MAG: hypothetical protein GC171_10980 [Terrimonas sp.]|nr:hypothetical protein [Terrimonas sp.]